jgi:spectrin beta
MIAKVTAPDLAQDVPGAEALLVRHEEHCAEIDTRADAFAQFSQTGHKLIAEGHFLANEILEKISILEQRKQLLNDTWARRKAIYEQNLDTQVPHYPIQSVMVQYHVHIVFTRTGVVTGVQA